MVNIQHRSLRAFEEHRFAVVERVAQQHGRIRHKPANVRGEFQILFEQACRLERMAVCRVS